MTKEEKRSCQRDGWARKGKKKSDGVKIKGQDKNRGVCHLISVLRRM